MRFTFGGRETARARKMVAAGVSPNVRASARGDR